MKNKSFNFLIFTLGLLLAMNACTKRPDSVDPVRPADNSLNDFFAEKRSKTQIFTRNANQNILIIGAKGSRVYIGGSTLRKMSGERVIGNVTIELKEVTEFSEMILNNAPTVSSGQILTSGGEFYVSATQNGEQLKLADNASFFIAVAAPRGTTDSMKVFTGVDSSGIITWDPVPTDTVNSKVIIPADSTQNRWDTSAYYQSMEWAIVNKVNEYVVKCTQFGWINCDYFASYPDICSITAKCDTTYKTTYTKVYFTIPATNSVGNFYIDPTTLNFFCNSIPNHTKLNIAAINYHDGKYYVALKQHTMDCGTLPNIAELDFIEVDEAQIESYLSQINI